MSTLLLVCMRIHIVQSGIMQTIIDISVLGNITQFSPVIPLSEASEIFASNGFSLSSFGGLYLRFSFEEFGVLSSLDSVVWILSVL